MSRFVGHGRTEVTLADELTPVDDHLAAILELLPTPEPIELRLADALGLVLAQKISSRINVPSFANSAMDGYAVVAGDLEGASASAPVELEVVGEIVAGATDLPRIGPGRCVRIMTGAPLPLGANAVVPVETTSMVVGDGDADGDPSDAPDSPDPSDSPDSPDSPDSSDSSDGIGGDGPVAADTGRSGLVSAAGGHARTRGESRVRFHRTVASGDHVRRPGEDLKVGQPLMAAGRRLTPSDLALLAVAGVTRVTCIPPPRVVILTSGDELVPADQEPGAGQIRDANGPMLAAMVRAVGAVPFNIGIIPDDRKALMYAFETNLGHADLFVCTGGASAGTRDLLPEVIGSLGEVWTAKVAMRPGMPQIRGVVGDHPVIGLPGNPVSAFVSFEVFVRPAIRQLQGRHDVERPTVVARAAQDLVAPARKRGFVRVRLSHDAAGWLASPTGAQGSHLVSSIARADGLAIVPEDVTRIAAGEPVRVQVLAE